MDSTRKRKAANNATDTSSIDGSASKKIKLLVCRPSFSGPAILSVRGLHMAVVGAKGRLVCGVRGKEEDGSV